MKLKKEFNGEIKPNIVFSAFKNIVESLSSDREAENFDGYLEKYLYSLNQASRKDQVKDSFSLNQSLLLKTKKQLDDIKKNKGKYIVGALVLAVLTAGGYYFRQRIGRNIGKVKNYSRKAWNVAKQYLKEKAVNFK